MTVQNFVLKIHSNRLAKNKWNLILPLEEARRNDELVALGSSQVLRWLDELNGLGDQEEEILSLKKQAKSIKKQKNSAENKRKLKKIYEELDRRQFKQDYVVVVMDKTSHFKRAAKGFKINGQSFVRMVSTNGGVKVGATIYISKRLSGEILKRIDNGRDKTVPLVPAKLEAYRALACSSSHPISKMPRIAVVPDCVTKFREDAIFVEELDSDIPTMRFEKDAELGLTESDGCGFVLPSVAEDWSKELGLSYVPGAFNTRLCWEKGIVLNFDFRRFAEEVAHTRIIKDVWGQSFDVFDVDLILTESMVKLHSCYDSIEHYMRCCEENKYQFSITKYSESNESIDNVHSMNYQFLAHFDLTDDDIDELLSDSITSIKDILSQDSRCASLFLHGSGIAERDPADLPNDYSKALLVDPRVHEDPYVMKRIYGLIKKKIRDLSIGAVNVKGNFSIIGDDPWSLAQSIFGMEVTGILKPHEIFSSFWREQGVSDVVCFRAPMSTAESIVKMHVSDSEIAADWFSNIEGVTLMSSFSGECHSLNGADKAICPLLR